MLLFMSTLLKVCVYILDTWPYSTAVFFLFICHYVGCQLKPLESNIVVKLKSLGATMVIDPSRLGL